MPQEDFRYVGLAGIFENVIPTRQLSISKFCPIMKFQKKKKKSENEVFCEILNCQILKKKKKKNCQISTIFGSIRWLKTRVMLKIIYFKEPNFVKGNRESFGGWGDIWGILSILDMEFFFFVFYKNKNKIIWQTCVNEVAPINMIKTWPVS